MIPGSSCKDESRILRMLGAILLVMVVAPAACEEAPRPSGLNGVWHLLDAGTQTTLFFLRANGDDYSLYSADWTLLETQVDVTPGCLEMTYLQGARPVIVRGCRQDGTLSGTLLRPHPQTPVEMAWEARQVLGSGDWDPWEALEAQGRPIDLVSPLVSLLPQPTDKEFQAVVERQVDPWYYPLLVSSLYTDSIGRFQEGSRGDTLDRIYRLPAEERDALSSAIDRIKRLKPEVTSDLLETYPWVELPTPLVLTLSFDRFDYQPVLLAASTEQAKPFMLIDVFWSRELSDLQVRYLIAQALLTSALRSHRVPPTSIQSEFAQRGVSALLASRLGYSEDPVEFLFQKRSSLAELVADYRSFGQDFSRHFRERAWRVQRSFFLKDHRAASYRFAFDFARNLSQRLGPREMIERFPYEVVGSEMTRYIRNTKSVPNVDKPF